MEALDKLIALAKSMHNQGEYYREIEYLKEAITISPQELDSVLIYEQIGTAYYLLDDKENAKTNYFAALNSASNLEERSSKELICSVKNYLGSVFFDQERYGEALTCKLDAIGCPELFEHQDLIQAIITAGICSEQLGKLDDAIGFYIKALEVPGISDDDAATVTAFAGRCYDKSGDHLAAFKYFNKAFTINGRYDGGWYMLYRYAVLAYQFGKYETAITVFHKALSDIPKDEITFRASSYEYIGYAYIACKQYMDALNELYKALHLISPSSSRLAYIYCGIAQGYFGLNETKKTIQCASRALNEQTDDLTKERLYFLLAYSYYLRKDETNAELYYKQLRLFNPESPYLRELRLTWGEII